MKRCNAELEKASLNHQKERPHSLRINIDRQTTWTTRVNNDSTVVNGNLVINKEKGKNNEDKGK